MSVEPMTIATLMQKNPQAQTAYNWVGVLEFLHDQHKQLQYKECDWAIEKSQLQSKINELEGNIKGLERIVSDYGKRVKMLEIALRQERLKYQSGGQSNDAIGLLLRENIDTNQIQNFQTIPKRKAKPYRPLLHKILQEVGISHIFSPPGSPKMDTSNRPSILLTPNQNIAIQNSGRQSPTNTTTIFPSHSRNKSQNLNEEQYKDPIQHVSTLRNHLDGVWDVFFFNHLPILTSISEDCQVKLWDISNLNQQQQIEPYLTLRDHTGPIFAVTGIEASSKLRGQQNFILSAGNEGVIKLWGFPTPDDEKFDSMGPTEEYQSVRCSWSAHQDAIWQLETSPLQNLFLSSGADSKIKLWSVQDILMGNTKEVAIFGQKNQYNHFVDSPTAITWLQTQNNFAAGFVQAPSLCVFDIETGRITSNIKYANDQVGQINSIQSHPSQNQLMTAHDDGRVRLFDLQTQKVVQNFQCGQDSVNSVISNLSGSLIYVACDTSLKAWDMRKMAFIQDLQPHEKKYDECIHKLVHHPNQNLFASCGADGQIKLFRSKYS
ncbi:hypothetical protein pb186bvf_005916 [Paramecium bursaria]